MNNSEDIIKKLINEASGKSMNNGKLSKEDIQRRLKTVDKKMAIEKLRSMGLGSVAERLKNTSDDELLKMISNNPALLKKLNDFLK